MNLPSDVDRNPPSLRDLVRAAAAAPDSFEMLAQQLLIHGQTFTTRDLEALLPDLDGLSGHPVEDTTEIALTLSETGTILSASDPAMRRFRLARSGADVTALGVTRGDLAALRARIGDHGNAGGGGGVSILMTQPPDEDRPFLMTADFEPETGLIRLRPLTSTWPPALDRVLEELYALSPRERLRKMVPRCTLHPHARGVRDLSRTGNRAA